MKIKIHSIRSTPARNSLAIKFSSNQILQQPSSPATKFSSKSSQLRKSPVARFSSSQVLHQEILENLVAGELYCWRSTMLENCIAWALCAFIAQGWNQLHLLLLILNFYKILSTPFIVNQILTNSRFIQSWCHDFNFFGLSKRSLFPKNWQKKTIVYTN